MKQKDILLWTITIAALLLSVLATFGSRINGVQTFAAKRPVVATQSQISTPINSTPIYNGGTVTANGQGPAGCSMIFSHLSNVLVDIVSGGGNPATYIDNLIDNCGGQATCDALDEAIATNVYESNGHVNGVTQTMIDAYNSSDECNPDHAGGRPTDGSYSRTFTGSGGDTCTSTNPEVHTYFECIEDNNQ